MRAVVDRLIMLACCAALLADKPVGIPDVAALLAALTVSGLNGYIGSVRLTLVSVGIYTAASAAYPYLCTFLPLVYYDIPRLAQGWSWGTLAATALSAAAVVAAVVAAGARQLGVSTTAAVLSLVAAAWALSLRTDAVRRSQTELRQLQDDNRELTLLLTRQQKELVEKRDYEVRLATLNERSRIAREIHDHVGHLLSRCLLQIGALMVTEREGPTKQSLAVVRETLSQAMDSIRSSVHNLHEESFDLKLQVETVASHFDFCPLRLDYRIQTEPDRDTSHCLLAIIKEGLSNIMRHSDATQATLTLLEHPALYQLVLQDNGTVRDGGSGGSGGLGGVGGVGGVGLGLRSMEERVAALGGQFLVQRKSGFRLFVSLPKGGHSHEGASRG